MNKRLGQERNAMRLIRVLVILVCWLGGIASALAQTYPAKPVRMIVPFPPGGAADIIGRVLAQKLPDQLGQQVIVDNRAGASGNIGAEAVAKAPADGYTILMGALASHCINYTLERMILPYDLQRDLTPITIVATVPYVLVVHPSIPAQSVQELVAHPAFPPRNAAELVAYAKANPGKINWGSSGTGGSPHYGLLILQSATGIDVTHVPFKGSAPSLVAIAAGQIQAMHSSVVSAEALLNGKRVKVIASASAKRLAALPDVPTFAEMGFANAESQVWFGMAAPPQTPRAVVGRLNAEVNRILRSADSVRRLRDLGLEILGGSPDDATKFVAREAQMVAKFIEQGKLKPD